MEEDDGAEEDLLVWELMGLEIPSIEGLDQTLAGFWRDVERGAGWESDRMSRRERRAC